MRTPPREWGWVVTLSNRGRGPARADRALRETLPVPRDAVWVRNTEGGGTGGAQVASAAKSELVNFSTLPLCN